MQALENAAPGAFKSAPAFGADPLARPPMPPVAITPVGVSEAPVTETGTDAKEDLQQAPPFAPVDSEDRGLGGGATAGIIAGILIPLGIIALVGWYCMRARRNRQSALRVRSQPLLSNSFSLCCLDFLMCHYGLLSRNYASVVANSFNSCLQKLLVKIPTNKILYVVCLQFINPSIRNIAKKPCKTIHAQLDAQY